MPHLQDTLVLLLLRQHAASDGLAELAELAELASVVPAASVISGQVTFPSGTLVLPLLPFVPTGLSAWRRDLQHLALPTCLSHRLSQQRQKHSDLYVYIYYIITGHNWNL